MTKVRLIAIQITDDVVYGAVMPSVGYFPEADVGPWGINAAPRAWELLKQLTAEDADVEDLKRRYGKELADAEEELALALDMEYGEYGYPTGDNTVVSLAMEVRRELEKARGERDLLRMQLARVRQASRRTIDHLVRQLEAVGQSPTIASPLEGTQ